MLQHPSTCPPPSPLPVTKLPSLAGATTVSGKSDHLPPESLPAPPTATIEDASDRLVPSSFSFQRRAPTRRETSGSTRLPTARRRSSGSRHWSTEVPRRPKRARLRGGSTPDLDRSCREHAVKRDRSPARERGPALARSGTPAPGARSACVGASTIPGAWQLVVKNVARARPRGTPFPAAEDRAPRRSPGRPSRARRASA